MKNGIHRMTTDEYNLVKRSRWSRAKYILECPEVYMHKLKTEDNATRSSPLDRSSTQWSWSRRRWMMSSSGLPR